MFLTYFLPFYLFLDCTTHIQHYDFKYSRVNLVKDVRGGSFEPGRYRRVQNYVVNSLTGEIIYTPPPSEKVQGLMKEFVERLNDEKDISPILMAGNHYRESS